MVLAFMVIGTLLVLPTLRYAATVSRATTVVDDKVDRLEAVKGGLRTALADPAALYSTCGAAGLTVPVRLTSPALDVSVTTNCYKMQDNAAQDPQNLRVGVGVVRTGATLPTGVGANVFSGSGASPEAAWRSQTTTSPATGKIWLPNLPARAVDVRAAGGYPMPAGFPACTVYFPGTYVDPIEIAGSTPVFFTSGIYYFTNSVHISGNANVVVGEGMTPGCTDNQSAVYYATDAPRTHNITGYGATFLFGGDGRLVIDDAAGPTNVTFNKRYVGDSEVSVAASAGVSIASVNGSGAGDVNVAGVLSVPLSMSDGNPAPPATSQGYTPSTLVPPDASTPVASIVEVDASTPSTLSVVIPGYVVVPQGAVRVNVAAGAAAGKAVQFEGGMLAATIDVPTVPATWVLDLKNPITQKVFKIVSTTTSGTPALRSDAIVQVNDNGAYAINSWAVG